MGQAVFKFVILALVDKALQAQPSGSSCAYDHVEANLTYFCYACGRGLSRASALDGHNHRVHGYKSVGRFFLPTTT